MIRRSTGSADQISGASIIEGPILAPASRRSWRRRPGLLVAVPLMVAIMVAVKMLYVEDVVGDDMDVGKANTT